jgi:uncharacterized delta-60 repeat protein
MFFRRLGLDYHLIREGFMKSKSSHRSLRAAVVETLEGRRLLSAGGLDTSFGAGGTFKQSFPAAQAMAVQSDGKTVVVGIGRGVVIERYLTNGKLDTTFGFKNSGIQTYNFVTSDFSGSEAFAVAIQPDGKIVVAGVELGKSLDSDVGLVIRMLPNGSLDTSFNKKGYTFIGNGGLGAVAIQRDGKIVVGGGTESETVFTHDTLLLGRLNSNGTPDLTFGLLSGTKTADIGDDLESVTAIAIDYNGTAANNPDYGNIVFAGFSSGELLAHSRFAIVRVTAKGKVDNSFAGDGQTETKFPGHAFAYPTGVVIQPGGKVVVSGYAGGGPLSGDHNFAMARYLTNGTLDKTFGTAKTGYVDTDLGGTDDIAQGMVTGFSQKLILVGASSGKLALAAYTPDGVLDPDFGGSGIVKTASLGPAISALALGPGRTIVTMASDDGSKIQVSRFFDVGPKVSLEATNSIANEQGQKSGTFEVFRDAALPFATRVYFTVGGTAKLGTDYTGITLKPQVNSQAFVAATTVSGVKPAIARPPIFQLGYVDIPAFEQTALVTIKPIDHGTTTNKTVQLALFGNELYDNNIAPFNSGTVTIVGDGAKPPPVTFENLTPTADAYVQDGSTAGTNFGTSKDLLIKSSSTAGTNRWTYLKFSLANISSISAADLVMDGSLNNNNANNISTQVFAVSSNNWTETGITWNNKPAATGNPLGRAIVVDTNDASYQLDLTDFFRAQLLAGNKTVSLVFKNPDNSAPYIDFHSREVGKGNGAPDLIIIN